MGSYSHLTAKNVDITTGGKLAIGALDDLNLDTVTFSAGRANKNDNITLYSDTNLNLTSPTFQGSAKEIYMQGITINLTDVTFDTSKMYHFRSKNGAPNFGSSSPGDVNFLGSNYWGSGSDKILLTENHFNELPDSAGVDGFNSSFNTDNSDTAGIRIRKIQ